MKTQFYFQHIPHLSWGRNCRNVLTKHSWNEVRTIVLQSNMFRCQWCGVHQDYLKDRFSTKNYKSYLNAHEVWVFDDDKQVLTDIIPLCHMCHQATHIRNHLYNNNGEVTNAMLKHLKKITGHGQKRNINNFINTQIDNNKYLIDITYLNDLAVKNNITLASEYKIEKLINYRYFSNNHSNMFYYKDLKSNNKFNIHKELNNFDDSNIFNVYEGD